MVHTIGNPLRKCHPARFPAEAGFQLCYRREARLLEQIEAA
jgi:hypothetical protein